MARKGSPQGSRTLGGEYGGWKEMEAAGSDVMCRTPGRGGGGENP